MYVVRKQVYYDNNKECYKNILVLNTLPTGSLRKYIEKLRPDPLSPFDYDATFNSCCSSSSCILAIKQNTHANCDFYCAENIADFFSLIISLGYKIETALTKLSKQSGDNNVICIISQ